ncbi:hypothetical protein [Pontibacter beigongshangensis]|uniref:hypothetical protein n=1 Tax=Pontibacter beigongshangensis TaxID=2574733 RepID=UPI001650216C|nr:hypothetical protein [Pontibacter beigongshangensis]
MVLDLVDKHQETIQAAIKALHTRTFFAHYPENPSPEIYGENTDKEAREKFKASLNKRFEELQQGEPEGWVGQEESPYEQQPLGITYIFNDCLPKRTPRNRVRRPRHWLRA